MNTIAPSMMQEIAYCVGWTVLHSFWQLSLLAALTAISLRVRPKMPARLRYGIGCTMLWAMMGACLVTFGTLYGRLPHARSKQTVAVDDGVRVVDAVVLDVMESTSNGLQASTGAGGANREPAIPRPVTGLLTDSFNKSEEPGKSGWTILPGSAIGFVSRTLSVHAVWISSLWMIGFVFAGAWRAGGWLAAIRIERLAAPPHDPSLRVRMKRLMGSRKDARMANLLESHLVASPQVVGWWRPTILFPSGLLNRLDSEKIDAILAHEMIHVQKCDYLINLLQSVIEAIFFYHPARWWLSRHIRAQREFRCDDEALLITGNSKQFAGALQDVAQWYWRQVAPSVSATGGDVVARIRRVLGEETVVAESRWRPVAACFSATLLAVVFIAADLRSTLADSIGFTTRGATEQRQQSDAGTAPEVPVDGASTAVHKSAVDAAFLRELGFTESASENLSLIDALNQELARQETTTALDAELERLADSDVGHPPSPDDIDRRAAELAARFRQPKERGRIYAEVARVSQSRSSRPDAILWVHAALKHPLSPLDRLRMYDVWSETAILQNEAAQRSGSNETRCNEVLPALLGLAASSRYQLPLSVPVGPRAKNALSRRVAAQTIREMVVLRDRFADRLAMVANSGVARRQGLSAVLRRTSSAGVINAQKRPLKHLTWVPRDVAFHTTVNVDMKQPEKWIGKVFDELFGGGQSGTFEETLESIHKDPFGPGIDVRREIFGNLSGRITVMVDYSIPNTPYGEGILFAAEAIDAQALAGTLDRMSRPDRSLQLTTRQGVDIWTHQPEDGTAVSVTCVARKHLLITSDAALLQRVLFDAE